MLERRRPEETRPAPIISDPIVRGRDLFRRARWVLSHPEVIARDYVEQAAQRRARVRSHLPQPMAERLGLILRDLRANIDERTPLELLYAYDDCVKASANALRLSWELEHHPDPEWRPPLLLVVSGLPRAGTTLLHRLLAADPELLASFSYRDARILPAGPAFRADPDRYRAAARLAIDASIADWEALAPVASLLHPVAADEPEECHALFENVLSSFIMHVMYGLPTYNTHLGNGLDPDVYAQYRAQLRLVTPDPARPIVVKSQNHVNHLDDLCAGFDNVKMLLCVRDPADVVRSVVRLHAECASARRGRAPDDDDVRSWLAWIEQLDSAIALCARRSECAVVRYEALASNPEHAVRTILDWAGLPAGREALRATKQLEIHPSPPAAEPMPELREWARAHLRSPQDYDALV